MNSEVTNPAGLGSPDPGMQQGHHDALIEQLAQRQQAFNQLGSMLGAMQQTSDLGSVEVLRTKLKVDLLFYNHRLTFHVSYLPIVGT